MLLPGHSEDAPADPEPAPAGVHKRRWLAAVCSIAALGLCVSVAASMTWRTSVQARERQAFRTSAANVSGSLDTLLRRDTDFVRSLQAILTVHPGLSASGVQQWLSLLEDRQRETAGYGALIVKAVPAGELASFQARRNADPAYRALVGGKVETVPATGANRYCLLSGGSANIVFDPALVLLLQGDWCNPLSPIGGFRRNGTTRARFTQAITDSGEYGAYLITFGTRTSLVIEGPAYRLGAPTATVAERRGAVVGWVLGTFDSENLLRSAIGGVRHIGITLYHANPGLGAEWMGSAGAVGRHPRFTQTTTLPVDGTWIVKVAGAVDPDGPLDAGLQALAVLLGGLIATALLCALVLVLARSRANALAMVEEKTGQLRHQALHDALTGLPNRVLALDRAEQMLARARRLQVPVAALYVDVDGFKEVNDSFGHAAGDELLRIVASRLESVVREGDTAARLGGDEFVVLVAGSSLDSGPERVAERLLEVLRHPYDMREEIGRELTLSASIGIAYGLRGSADELLRDADIALYAAKAAGRDRHVLFQSDMQRALQDRLATQLDLAEALHRDELFLLYRPVFDLQTGRVAGVEALLRWRHPRRGTLTPREFLPVAETSGMIVPIGRWVLGEACRQAAAWHARGLRVPVSVNISSRQLKAEELVDHVGEALRRSGLEPAALTLEIGEPALLGDDRDTAARVRALAALGVHIAVDDFGARYGVLASLHELPADAVKLDTAVIRRIALSPSSTDLMHAFLALGKTLDIDTLGEGVEDHVKLDPTQRDQCDHGHGFLFSRPLDARAMEAFLAASAFGAQPEPTP